MKKVLWGLTGAIMANIAFAQNVNIAVEPVRSVSFGSILTIISVVLVVVGAIAYITWYYKKTKAPKKDEKEPKTAMGRIELSEPEVEIDFDEGEMDKFLKEDEKIIVNILKTREGKCEQGTLTYASSFSKAKLSRLLQELEQRNIIKRQLQGKKKLVILKGF